MLRKIFYAVLGVFILGVNVTYASYENPVSCTKTQATLSDTGTFACYGLSARDTLFKLPEDHSCMIKGQPKTGCNIEASVCKAGYAVATELFDISKPGLFTWNIYGNLKITEQQLKDSVSYVWEYTCSEKIKNSNSSKTEILIDGKKVAKKVPLDITVKNVTVSVMSPSIECTTDIKYGKKLFRDTKKFFYLSPVNQYGLLSQLKTTCVNNGKKSNDTVEFKSKSATTTAKGNFVVTWNSKKIQTKNNIRYSDALVLCQKAYQNHSSSSGTDILECYFGGTLLKRYSDWPG
jgi:hypothetical protein